MVKIDDIGLAEIAEAVREQAQRLSESCELAEPVVALLPAELRGMRDALEKNRRRAVLLGRAYAILIALARYEREVIRLVKLSRAYADRRRWRFAFWR